MNQASQRPNGDVVEVRVPADVVYVSTLRLAAAALAARCELTVDDIEDLRLAVDEACALLLPHATPGSALEARFQLAYGRLEVRASIRGVEGAEVDRSGFAWTVLGALAAPVDVRQADGTITIALTKRREDATQ
ncbi:MAG: ATP-binding protein [Pseudonocardiales bacterium]|nr:ATP-binding protein [Actinomycetota bacterium]